MSRTSWQLPSHRGDVRDPVGMAMHFAAMMLIPTMPLSPADRAADEELLAELVGISCVSAVSLSAMGVQRAMRRVSSRKLSAKEMIQLAAGFARWPLNPGVAGVAGWRLYQVGDAFRASLEPG